MTSIHCDLLAIVKNVVLRIDLMNMRIGAFLSGQSDRIVIPFGP